MQEIDSRLTTEEEQLLINCEKTIETGLQTFYEVGQALLTVKDRKLFRDKYRTFAEYSRQRWDLRSNYANRYVRATIVCQALQSTGVLPKNEHQARTLGKLPEEQWLPAWQSAIEAAKGEVELCHIEQAVERFLPAPPNDRRFGESIDLEQMKRAPINEMGVVFLFGAVCKRLGFEVESVHAGFPDCSAKRLMDSRRVQWKEVRIEFEYLSKNFQLHQHPTDGCDLIVCWIHNWPECPIEVIALKDAIDDVRHKP